MGHAPRFPCDNITKWSQVSTTLTQSTDTQRYTNTDIHVFTFVYATVYSPHSHCAHAKSIAPGDSCVFSLLSERIHIKCQRRRAEDQVIRKMEMNKKKWKKWWRARSLLLLLFARILHVETYFIFFLSVALCRYLYLPLPFSFLARAESDRAQFFSLWTISRCGRLHYTRIVYVVCAVHFTETDANVRATHASRSSETKTRDYVQ